jgi:hypothetical protein
MKDKNRISKIITGIVVSSVFSALIGFVLSDIFNLRIKKIPIEPVYLVLLFGIIAILLTTIILLRIETVDEYRNEVTKILGDGFIRIYKDSISEFAITLVNRSKYVRVVGTARQDVLKNRSMKGAQDYLRSLEKRLERPSSDTSNAFTYLRVVPRPPNQELEEHLEKCQVLAGSKGHKFEYKTILHFHFYISFQIFDNTDLLVILDNKGYDKKHDNALCLWSRNKEIIDVFINRFDNAWEDS